MEASAYYHTPIGILHAVFRDDVLCTLILADTQKTPRCTDTPAANALGDALKCYFAGDTHALDGIPIHPEGTPFQRKVWEALRTIPPGQTRTYGEIAAQIGQPGAARAVGGACNKNRMLLLIPCHRVVASSGKIGGFAYGTEIKRQLLRLESANR